MSLNKYKREAMERPPKTTVEGEAGAGKSLCRPQNPGYRRPGLRKGIHICSRQDPKSLGWIKLPQGTQRNGTDLRVPHSNPYR